MSRPPKQQKERSETEYKGKVRDEVAAMNNCAAWEEKIMRENLQLICALVRFPLEVTSAACVTCLRCERKWASQMSGKNVVFTKRGLSANHKLTMEEVTQSKLAKPQLTKTLKRGETGRAHL